MRKDVILLKILKSNLLFLSNYSKIYDFIYICKFKK